MKSPILSFFSMITYVNALEGRLQFIECVGSGFMLRALCVISLLILTATLNEGTALPLYSWGQKLRGMKFPSLSFTVTLAVAHLVGMPGWDLHRRELYTGNQLTAFPPLVFYHMKHPTAYIIVTSKQCSVSHLLITFPSRNCQGRNPEVWR